MPFFTFGMFDPKKDYQYLKQRLFENGILSVDKLS